MEIGGRLYGAKLPQFSGYPTTEALRTGNASECHTANAEVVAVLAVPSSGS